MSFDSVVHIKSRSPHLADPINPPIHPTLSRVPFRNVPSLTCERETQTERVANLSERILEDLNVDNGAVLAKVLAQLVGRRLPAETAHKELVVRQVGRSRATGRAALIQGQSAHCDFRFDSAAGRPVAIAIHPRSASTSVAKSRPHVITFFGTHQKSRWW